MKRHIYNIGICHADVSSFTHSEVLALPADCEVFETDREGIERYGWRFFAGKGYEGDIKWIPTVMVSVAKTAVARIKMLTENARQLAKWIESHPNKFYRHANCPDVADDEPLTMEQSCMALGLVSESKKCRSSLYNRGLTNKDGVHTLKSLWQHTWRVCLMTSRGLIKTRELSTAMPCLR
jgi:hypothetical protein